MRLTQCITAKTFLLCSISVGLNLGIMGLGCLIPSQVIAASETSETTNIHHLLSWQKSPLSPPETDEPKPSNIRGGV